MREIDDARGSPRESHDTAAEAVLAALPSAPLDPSFSRQVLRAARAELDVANSPWKRAELFVTRVLVPAALVACAAGWALRFVLVARHIFASHGG